LIAPSFSGQSFWNFRATCEVYGASFPAAPLGLITVAALLPCSWQCRLVNRNTEDLLESDLDWADLVMTGGMLPQQPDTLRVIELAHARRKPVVVGGPDVTSSPEAYKAAGHRQLSSLGRPRAMLAGLVHGSPEPVLLAGDLENDVIKMPLVSRARQPTADLIGESLAEFQRHCRTVSWLMTMPRAASISSTMRRLSGKRK
jgi:hypothetical protein